MKFIVVCTALILMLFGCSKREDAIEPGDKYVYTEPVESAASAEKISYRVVAENGYLNLYQADSIKKSEPFDSQLYPAKDVLELENGVTFDDIEAAFAFLESYIS